MIIELPLTRANRLKLARVFRNNKRVDYAIDCVIEGQMGRALVADRSYPTAFCINIGPFHYYAGEAASPEGHALLQDFPSDGLLMPSPPSWIAAARQTFPDRLHSFPRYSFSPAQLTADHLRRLLADSPYRNLISPLEQTHLAQLASQPDRVLDYEAYDSPDDFLERGGGFLAQDKDHIMGAAYASLVCSQGIEVSIFVADHFRRRGVGTALASQLVLDCLHRGGRPNWDAANPESCKLALKLGYTFSETYDAYYLATDSNAAQHP